MSLCNASRLSIHVFTPWCCFETKINIDTNMPIQRYLGKPSIRGRGRGTISKVSGILIVTKIRDQQDWTEWKNKTDKNSKPWSSNENLHLKSRIPPQKNKKSQIWTKLIKGNKKKTQIIPKSFESWFKIVDL